jgi:hypothetical protein
MNKKMKMLPDTSVILLARAFRVLFTIPLLAAMSPQVFAVQKTESVKEIAEALLKQGSVVVKSPPKLGSNSTDVQDGGQIQIVNVPEYTYAQFDFDSEWDAADLPKDVVEPVRAQIEIELNRKFLSPSALHGQSLDNIFEAFEREIAEAWEQHKFKEFLADSVQILHDRIKDTIEAQTFSVRVGMVSRDFRGTVLTVSNISDRETFDITVTTSPVEGKVSIVPLTEYRIAKGRKLAIPWHEVVQQPISLAGVIHYKIVWPNGNTAEGDTQKIGRSGQITLR